MLKLSFKQTNAEIMVRAAATVLFYALERNKIPQVSIAELSERPQYGFTASAVVEPVGPKLVRITDLQDGKIDWRSVPFCKCETPDKYMLRENDILFARTGATTGKTYLVCQPQPAVFASYLIRLRPKPGVNAGYLYAFFQSNNYWSQILAEKEGSAQPNVNGEKLSSLFIPIVPPELQDGIAEFLKCVRARQDGASTELPDLPPPLAEQRWIVAKMEELAAKIEEARGLQQQTMEDAWTLLDSTRATIFKKMSSSWKVQKLDEVAPINMGQSPPGGTYNTFGDGIPLLNGPTEFGEKFPTPIQWTTAPTKLCKPGDILLCVRASVGRMNWAEKEYCIGRGLAALTPDPKVCLPEYVYYFVETQTQEMLKLAAGSTFPNLPGAKLKVLEIPVPPILEQRRVVAYLDSIQKKIMPLKHLQSQTAAELEALLPSILDKAFKGEL